MRAAARGLSGRADARGRVAAVCRRRRRRRCAAPFAAWRIAGAHLWRHDQRRAGCHPALHLHGRDAGALAHRRGVAGDHGPAVRCAAGRPGCFGGYRRRAARRGERHCRRHGGDHGADRAADHAAPWLRQGAGRGHDRGDRHSGADLSAGDRPGPARRPAQQFVSGGAIGAGKFRPANSLGCRSIRGSDHSGLCARPLLSSVPDRRGDCRSEEVAADCSRSQCAARL